VGFVRQESRDRQVVVRGRARKHEGIWLVTLFLVNGQADGQRSSARWIFQAELSVTAGGDAPAFLRRAVRPAPCRPRHRRRRGHDQAERWKGGGLPRPDRLHLAIGGSRATSADTTRGVASPFDVASRAVRTTAATTTIAPRRRLLVQRLPLHQMRHDPRPVVLFERSPAVRHDSARRRQRRPYGVSPASAGETPVVSRRCPRRRG
jgi:hypothetical protein